MRIKRLGFLCLNRDMNYLICGFSGAGKSHLLNKISQSKDYANYQCIDLDEKIFSIHGDGNKDLGELIEARGFDWFRAVEQKVLKELLQNENQWISLGGGTLNQELISYIDQQTNIKGLWLNTDFETCWKRISTDVSRPLTKEGQEKMHQRYLERNKLYSHFDVLSIKDFI